jgi:phage FluMu gp28-like protein
MELAMRYLHACRLVARVFWSTTGDRVRHIKHGSPREGIFTWVVEKRDGRWLIVASQNAEAMPVLPGQ